MSSLRDSFGKPKEGSQYKVITLGEGESKIFRFFPPMKSMAAKGVWARYVKQHYGYGVKDSKNPDGKLRLRPFECIEVKDESGLITTSCPEHEHVENQKQAEKDSIALRSADLISKGVDAATIAKEVENVKKAFAVWFKEHNLDSKWLIPVKTEDGQFALLKIPHAGKKNLDKVRAKEKAKKKSVDMLDIDNGFWVRITRTGTGLKTEYDVEPVTETRYVEGVGDVEVIKAAPLSDADLEQGLAIIPDLGSSTLVRRLTKDQIQALVNSKGNPDVVDTIMKMSQKVKTADSTDEDAGYDEPTPEPARTPVVPTVATVPVVSHPVTVTTPVQVAQAVEEDEEAALMKKLEAARAAKAAKAEASKPTGAQQAAKTTGSPLDPNLSDDDFMARFGPRA